MATIVWARHGQNVANLTRTLSFRSYDGDLTELGRRQASELARALAARQAGRVGRVVSSPLRRARQTADIVASALRLEVTGELDDLREVNVGDLDGRSDPDAWQVYDRVLAAWRAGSADVRFPGGENCRELCARLLRALCQLADADVPAGQASLVVAHGASLRAVAARADRVTGPGRRSAHRRIRDARGQRRPRARCQLAGGPM